MQQPILPDSTSWVQHRSRRHLVCGCFALVSLTVFVYVVALGATPNSTVQLSAGSAETALDTEGVTLANLISNPDTMFANYGFVSIPILCVSIKGIVTFGMQTGFFLGSASFGGFQEMQRKMNGHMEFSRTSIAFQVLGQASAMYSYAKIAIATSCWAGWEQFADFGFLASQHHATITIIFGLANNYAVQCLLPRPTIDASWERERTIARILLGTGFGVGIPIWSSLVATCLSWNMILFILAVVISFYATRFLHPTLNWENLDLWHAKNADPLASWSIIGMLSVFVLAFFWFCFGFQADSWHACLLLGATLVELFVPLMVILFFFSVYFDLTVSGSFYGMLTGFGCAFATSYVVAMLIPTCLMEHETGIYFGDAAVQVFWGKKVGKYFSYTFFATAQHDIEQLQKTSTAASDLLGSWLSQLLAFFA